MKTTAIPQVEPEKKTAPDFLWDMEQKLGSAESLCTALCLMSDGIRGENGSAVSEVALLIREHLADIEEMRCNALGLAKGDDPQTKSETVRI